MGNCSSIGSYAMQGVFVMMKASLFGDFYFMTYKTQLNSYNSNSGSPDLVFMGGD